MSGLRTVHLVYVETRLAGNTVAWYVSQNERQEKVIPENSTHFRYHYICLLLFFFIFRCSSHFLWRVACLRYFDEHAIRSSTFRIKNLILYYFCIRFWFRAHVFSKTCCCTWVCARQSWSWFANIVLSRKKQNKTSNDGRVWTVDVRMIYLFLIYTKCNLSRCRWPSRGILMFAIRRWLQHQFKYGIPMFFYLCFSGIAFGKSQLQIPI